MHVEKWWASHGAEGRGHGAPDVGNPHTPLGSAALVSRWGGGRQAEQARANNLPSARRCDDHFLSVHFPDHFPFFEDVRQAHVTDLHFPWDVLYASKGVFF